MLIEQLFNEAEQEKQTDSGVAYSVSIKGNFRMIIIENDRDDN